MTAESICPACTTSKPIIPAVVIPFYERDLCKFRYFAKSISVHDPNHFLADVYLMWVSTQSPSQYQDQLDGIRGLINKTHPVHFYDFSPQVQSGGVSGWYAQQVLKLKIASVVLSDYYLVLDSKNALIRDVEKDTLVTSCNQAITFAEYTMQSIPDPHNRWYATTAMLLGLTIPTQGYWPASISPMTFHRATVLRLLRFIGEEASPYSLCAGRLCDWLKQGATEFILYQLYSRLKADAQCIHAVKHMDRKNAISISLWRGLSTNFEACKNVASGHNRPLFFGAQAGAMDKLWGTQREQATTNFVKIFEDAKLHDTGIGETTGEFIGCIVGHEW